MNRILFNTTLLKSDAQQSQTALTWNNIEGVLPPIDDQPLTADAYRFVVNGIEYQPNDFLDGTTKFKCSYKLSGHDSIMLELIKETGLANIKVRTDDGLDLGNGDSLTFKFFVIMDGKELSKNCIVKFRENLIARVSYENDEWKVEEL